MGHGKHHHKKITPTLNWTMLINLAPLVVAGLAIVQKQADSFFWLFLIYIIYLMSKQNRIEI